MPSSSELFTAHDNRCRFATSVVSASANLLAEASMMSKGFMAHSRTIGNLRLLPLSQFQLKVLFLLHTGYITDLS